MAPLQKNENQRKSLNFKVVQGFFISGMSGIVGLKQTINLYPVYSGNGFRKSWMFRYIVSNSLFTCAMLFCITELPVWFPDFVSLKIEPYGKKKIQRAVLLK